MADVKINSIVRFDEVYIKGNDLVKSLYHDLSMANTSELKTYLHDRIDSWEKYMDSARESKK
jgi:hypothetical protein